MSQPSPHLKPGFQIGDYSLTSLSESLPDRQIWLGRQVSIKRKVEVVCYFGENRESFLADAQTQAKIEDSIIGLVYEAIATKDFIALAREVLPTKSLQAIAQYRVQLLPIEATRILSQIAGALAVLERQGIAQQDLKTSDIRLGIDNAVRLQNIAKAGPRETTALTRQALTAIFRPIVKSGQPGSTRLSSVFDYIEGTPEQAPIPWSQVEELTRRVDHQLSNANQPPKPSAPSKKKTKKTPTGLWTVLGVLGLAIAAWFLFLQNTSPSFDPDLVITVPAKNYALPSGGERQMESFRIDATEVTIGEYADFLAAWEELNNAQQEQLWPEDKPASKTSLLPKDWKDYSPIAGAQGTWNGRQLSLNCPVMGVDWWDAQTYARWKKGFLPTEEQWWAASHSILAADNEQRGWGPVRMDSEGETIFGLNGNVAEWAQLPSRDPAFPINPPKPVALGGSFLRESKDAFTREWLDSFDTRREDLGFRVAYDMEQ